MADSVRTFWKAHLRLAFVVPLDRTNHADDVEAFCAGFGRTVAAERSQTFVATITKAKRIGKILIDWLRNRRKATAILPWSVRADRRAHCGAVRVG